MRCPQPAEPRLPIRDSEAIRLVRPLPCIADADPWECTDLSPRNLRSPVFEPQMPTSRHVDAVQRAVDGKSAAEPPWPVNQPPLDLHGSDQHRSRKFCLLRHDIQAVIHAIDHVDVGDAWRPEQNLGPQRPSLGGMASQIVWADVRFDLNDSPCHGPGAVLLHQIFAQQRSCDHERRAIEIGLGKNLIWCHVCIVLQAAQNGI